MFLSGKLNVSAPSTPKYAWVEAPAGEEEVVVRDGRADIDEHAAEEVEVLLSLEDVARGLRDLPRLEPRRADLIQQRLELVVVVAIHEEHVHGRFPQGADGFEPRVPRADDDDTRTRLHPVGGGSSVNGTDGGDGAGHGDTSASGRTGVLCTTEPQRGCLPR